MGRKRGERGVERVGKWEEFLDCNVGCEVIMRWQSLMGEEEPRHVTCSDALYR